MNAKPYSYGAGVTDRKTYASPHTYHPLAYFSYAGLDTQSRRFSPVTRSLDLICAMLI